MHIVLVFSLIGVVTFIRSYSLLRDTRKIEIICSGLLIFIFSALRGQTVGVDLPTYSNNFIQIASWSVTDILNSSTAYSWSRDQFFWVFLKFLTYVSVNPQIMIVAISAIVAISISILIYRSKSDVLICFLIFTCLRYFSFTMTGLRQAIAMSILYFAFKYLGAKKFIPFVVITLIAMTFHQSALLFLLAYPIMLLKKTRYILILCSFFLFISFSFKSFFSVILSFLPFFEDRFHHYSQIKTGSSGYVISGVYFVIMIFFLINQKKLSNYILKMKIGNSQIKLKDFKDTNSIIQMHYNFFIFGTALSFVGIFVPNLFRIAYFFIIPSLFFLLPRILSYTQKMFQIQPLKFVVIVLLLFQYGLIGPGSGTPEYVFFWE